MRNVNTKLSLEILVLNDLLQNKAIDKEIYDKTMEMLIRNAGDFQSFNTEEKIDNLAV